MMQLIESFGVYERAEAQTAQLVNGIQSAIDHANAPMQVNAIGTMFTVFFSNQPIQNVDDVNACDMGMFNRYFHYLKDNGILIPPSQYEANFVSSEHSDDIVQYTIRVIAQFIKAHWGS